jgi:glycosyltransferase involved in cell wall biosynthesis
MPDIYHQADAVIVPARYESFGYVALEAMACGLPVVGFRTTGTAEVCVDGETALLSPLGDVEHLLSNARTLAANALLCKALGEAGRARASKFFGEDKAIQAYVAIYESLQSASRR